MTIRLLLSGSVVAFLFLGCMALSPRMSPVEGLLAGILSGAVSGLLIRIARSRD